MFAHKRDVGRRAFLADKRNVGRRSFLLSSETLEAESCLGVKRDFGRRAFVLVSNEILEGDLLSLVLSLEGGLLSLEGESFVRGIWGSVWAGVRSRGREFRRRGEGS